jgi:hypothetical protein
MNPVQEFIDSGCFVRDDGLRVSFPDFVREYKRAQSNYRRKNLSGEDIKNSLFEMGYKMEQGEGTSRGQPYTGLFIIGIGYDTPQVGSGAGGAGGGGPMSGLHARVASFEAKAAETTAAKIRKENEEFEKTHPKITPYQVLFDSIWNQCCHLEPESTSPGELVWAT